MSGTVKKTRREEEEHFTGRPAVSTVALVPWQSCRAVPGSSIPSLRAPLLATV